MSQVTYYNVVRQTFPHPTHLASFLYDGVAARVASLVNESGFGYADVAKCRDIAEECPAGLVVKKIFPNRQGQIYNICPEPHITKKVYLSILEVLHEMAKFSGELAEPSQFIDPYREYQGVYHCLKKRVNGTETIVGNYSNIQTAFQAQNLLFEVSGTFSFSVETYEGNITATSTGEQRVEIFGKLHPLKSSLDLLEQLRLLKAD